MKWTYDADSPRRDTSIPVEEEVPRLDGVPVERKTFMDRLRTLMRLVSKPHG